MAPSLDFLTIARAPTRDEATVGQLFIKGDFKWWTMEDTIRPIGVKVTGRTAIPAGRYNVIISQSARFSQKAGHPVFLPLLQNVPMFSGIRIHAGNAPADTDGCILVGGGYNQRANLLIHSRPALDAVIAAIRGEFDEGRAVWISIFNAEESKDPGGLSGSELVA